MARSLPVILAASLVCGCVTVGAAPQSTERDVRLSSLNWLVGSWAHSRPDGTHYEEHWVGSRGGVMLGIHRMVKGDGPAWFEHLRIEDRGDSGIFYVAKPKGSPVGEFRLTRQMETLAEFERDGTDFPQRITYSRVGAWLYAKAEGRDEGGETRVAEWEFRYLGPWIPGS